MELRMRRVPKKRAERSQNHRPAETFWHPCVFLPTRQSLTVNDELPLSYCAEGQAAHTIASTTNLLTSMHRGCGVSTVPPKQARVSCTRASFITLRQAPLQGSCCASCARLEKTRIHQNPRSQDLHVSHLGRSSSHGVARYTNLEK